MARERRGITRRQFVAAGGLVAGGAALLRAQEVTGQEEQPEMVEIPGGRVVLGTTEAEARRLAQAYEFHASWLMSEAPERTVELPPYLIDRFPVTNAQYATFCDKTSRQWMFRPTFDRDPEGLGPRPAGYLNLRDAQAYAQWAGKRLPTEDEWEFAARGPERLLYPWGNTWDPARCNCNADEIPGGRGPLPVDAFPEGASPFGVHDMAGNLAEWTASEHGQSFMVKSGFFRQSCPLHFRPASRLLTQLGGNAQDYIGFRCAADL